MSKTHLAVATIAVLVATVTGCSSERADSGEAPDRDHVPPISAQVNPTRPETTQCTEEILPGLMGETGFQVIRSEASRAGCVVLLEAFAPPELVSNRATDSAKQLGYDLTGNVPAKGGQRLTYSEGADGLAISILIRGEGPVAMQHPDGQSHLELHWYNPVLM